MYTLQLRDAVKQGMARPSLGLKMQLWVASVTQTPVLESDLHRGVGWDSAVLRPAKQTAISLGAIGKLWWDKQRPGAALFDSRHVIIAKNPFFPAWNHLHKWYGTGTSPPLMLGVDMIKHVLWDALTPHPWATSVWIGSHSVTE